ncbi:hypothetical protein BJY04DRAFT_184098 [Aspergillus karnatakaensis]|uniref:uncharacterized protein n=1 Tax=Aspergillus karnatakaensis TaxID=1810916 RepID=UPI003CCD8D01
MGVAIVILYGIMSTSSIGFGAAAWYEDRVRSRRWARLPEPSVRDVISEIVLLPLHALSGALSGVAMLLPHSAKQKLTSVWHSTNQRTIDISISAATVATSLYQKLHKTMSSWYIQTVPFKDTNSPKTPLIKALGTPLILINIAQHLHHTDAVNLALASKAVHKALQPPTTTSTPGSRFLTSPGPGTLDSEPEPKTEEEEHLLPKATPQAEKQLLPSASSSPSASEYLRSLTCTGTKKLECWGCGLQICKTCSAKSWTRNPPISHHITLCSPRCASCAQTQIRNHGHGPCICSVTDGRNADRAREIFLADLYEDRTVCSKCGFCLLNREVMDRRAEYGREIYRREMLVRGVVCGGCGVALDLKSRGLGEVWWVCAGGEDGKGCGSVCEGCECECLILGDRKGGMEKKEREEGVSYVGDGWSWSWPGL